MDLDELTEAMIANLMRQNELLKERLRLEEEENYRHRQRLMDEEDNLQW
tara:strand:+ start:2019 stop:2165 length:147 start_codon:yes stop_codon:yes gene_type:complete